MKRWPPSRRKRYSASRWNGLQDSIRFRREGSSGGHNGLESIITHVGTEAFARLRLGIDRDRGGLIDHVLGKFSPAERKVMDDAYIDATRGVALWVTGGIDKCMNEFNG